MKKKQQGNAAHRALSDADLRRMKTADIRRILTSDTAGTRRSVNKNQKTLYKMRRTLTLDPAKDDNTGIAWEQFEGRSSADVRATLVDIACGELALHIVRMMKEDAAVSVDKTMALFNDVALPRVRWVEIRMRVEEIMSWSIRTAAYATAKRAFPTPPKK